VSIEGLAKQGQTLSASHSLVDSDGVNSLAYQWKADSVNISGATTDSLLLQEAHVGKVITVVATYLDNYGVSTSVSSIGTSAVEALILLPTQSAHTSALVTTQEDVEVEITYDMLKTKGNAVNVTSFELTDISNGILRIGISSGLTSAYSANNKTVDNISNNKAYWTPSRNLNGRVNAFKVTAVNGSGSSTPIQAEIEVTAVNDAPEIVEGPQTVTLSSTEVVKQGTFTATDVDSTGLTWSISGTNTYGTIDISNNAGTWKYNLSSESAPYKGLANGEIKDETYTVTVSDGILTATRLLTVKVTGRVQVVAPSAPTSFTVSGLNGQITISNINSVGTGIDKYAYNISSSSTNWPNSDVDFTGSSTTITTGITAEQTYYIKLKAHNSAGYSAYSTYTQVKPTLEVSITIGGAVIDGYIKNGTITIKDLATGISRGTTTSDQTGNYTLPATLVPNTKYIITSVGGTDIATNAVLTYPLSIVYETGAIVVNVTNINITPLTTMVTTLVAGGQTLTSATTKVATALGISAASITSDYIGVPNTSVAVAAVKVATLISTLTTATAGAGYTGGEIVTAVAQTVGTQTGVIDFTQTSLITSVIAVVNTNNSSSTDIAVQTATNISAVISQVSTTLDAIKTSGTNTVADLTNIYKTEIGAQAVVTTNVSTINSATIQNVSTAISNATSSATVGIITTTAQVTPPVDGSITIGGAAIDGYIKNATITIKDLEGILRGTTTSDQNGNYTLPATLLPNTTYIIKSVGGTDIATNAVLTYPLSRVYVTGATVVNVTNINVTPLTSMVAALVATGQTLASATTKVATALGISEASINSDYIGVPNTSIAVAALKVATLINTFATVTAAAGYTGEEIVRAVAQTLGEQTGVINFTEPSQVTSIVTAIVTKLNTNGKPIIGGQTVPNISAIILQASVTLEAIKASGTNTVADLTNIYKTLIGAQTVVTTNVSTISSSAIENVSALLSAATSTATVGIITTNICFKAGTKIVTDQGIVNIEKITRENSIRGKKVLYVSKTENISDDMIIIKKGGLYDSVPNADTYLTEEHKIFYNREMIKVKHLVNGETIIRKKMRKEIVYNVLLEGETSGKMIANGLISETLDPRSPMVKLLLTLEEMSDSDKEEIIKVVNKKMKKEHEKRETKKLKYF